MSERKSIPTRGDGDYGIFLQGAFSQVVIGVIVLLALPQGAAWLAGFRRNSRRDVP